MKPWWKKGGIMQLVLFAYRTTHRLVPHACCRCTQQLNDGLEGQCNWVLEESFPQGERSHVCSCVICDTKIISCCETADCKKEKNRTFQGTVQEPLWSKANGQLAMTSTQKSLQRLWFISMKKMNTFFQWLFLLPLNKAKRKTWQKSCYLGKNISRQERSHSSTYFYSQDWKVASLHHPKIPLKGKETLSFVCIALSQSQISRALCQGCTKLVQQKKKSVGTELIT